MDMHSSPICEVTIFNINFFKGYCDALACSVLIFLHMVCVIMLSKQSYKVCFVRNE